MCGSCYQQFVYSPKMLGLFLSFVSVSSYLGPKIKIGFNSQEPGFWRSPSVNTCFPYLHLPTSYASFTSEFMNILNNSDKWHMDLQQFFSNFGSVSHIYFFLLHAVEFVIMDNLL